jgi:hypothetical protein
MRGLRWLLLLCGILCLPYTALADSCPGPQGHNDPPPGVTQGPYTLTLCVDPSVVVENGPLGKSQPTFLAANPVGDLHS